MLLLLPDMELLHVVEQKSLFGLLEIHGVPNGERAVSSTCVVELMNVKLKNIFRMESPKYEILFTI